MKMISTLILVLLATVAFAGDQAPWVDFQGCPICSNVTHEEGLMENMAWEHHLTASGVMTVSTVKPEFQPQFDRAKAKMKAVLGKVLAGEKIEVCGYCTSLTSLLKDGAKAENIITSASDIMMFSSTDEAMILKIHKHAQKTNDFLESAHKGDDQ